MSEHAVPESVAPAGKGLPESAAPAEQIGLSAREAKAAVQPRDAGNWAAKVERLAVEQRDGVRGTNVAGRRLTGPVQGFGKMWEKSYTLNAGQVTTPQHAIGTWKAHFPEFWPTGNRFAGALAGISPGDVALLDLAIGGGVKLSTGVFVLYADEESFTLMTPQGHLFAGWITFSAYEEHNAIVVQAQVLMRASDPLYELGLRFGGHKQENQFWQHTLQSLAAHVQGDAPITVQMELTCVDPRLQWSQAKNIWHNAAMRTAMYKMATPLRWIRGRKR